MQWWRRLGFICPPCGPSQHQRDGAARPAAVPCAAQRKHCCAGNRQVCSHPSYPSSSPSDTFSCRILTSLIHFPFPRARPTIPHGDNFLASLLLHQRLYVRLLPSLPSIATSFLGTPPLQVFCCLPTNSRAIGMSVHEIAAKLSTALSSRPEYATHKHSRVR